MSFSSFQTNRNLSETNVALSKSKCAKEQKTVLKFPAAPSFKHVSVIKAADEHGIVLMHTNLRLLI
ncbi:2202_t:CDS:2 [Rhizophagus irregularis]|nr:2202_t:CDS:2 [Rhizophagus irregularis]